MFWYHKKKKTTKKTSFLNKEGKNECIKYRRSHHMLQMLLMKVHIRKGISSEWKMLNVQLQKQYTIKEFEASSLGALININQI